MISAQKIYVFVPNPFFLTKHLVRVSPKERGLPLSYIADLVLSVDRVAGLDRQTAVLGRWLFCAATGSQRDNHKIFMLISVPGTTNTPLPKDTTKTKKCKLLGKKKEAYCIRIL